MSDRSIAMDIIFLLIIISMSWLKKKIRKMGLIRRGAAVVYTPLSLVKTAIRVILAEGSIYLHCLHCVYRKRYEAPIVTWDIDKCGK